MGNGERREIFFCAANASALRLYFIILHLLYPEVVKRGEMGKFCLRAYQREAVPIVGLGMRQPPQSNRPFRRLTNVRPWVERRTPWRDDFTV